MMNLNANDYIDGSFKGNVQQILIRVNTKLK